MAALEAYDVVVLGDNLDDPLGALRGAVAVLGNGLLVVVGGQVFVVVAAESHHLGAVEEVHASKAKLLGSENTAPLFFSCEGDGESEVESLEGDNLTVFVFGSEMNANCGRLGDVK